jgi:isoquinoline 1-oxidoreductase beta subunit
LSREEDFKTGFFRAMAAHRVRADADAAGSLTAIHHEMVAEPTSPNLPFVGDVLFKEGVDFMTITGVADTPYAVPNFRLASTNFESGVPIMVWRSVGNSHTEFARESAIEAGSCSGSAPPRGARWCSATAARSSRRTSTATRSCGCARPQRSKST